MIRRLLLVSLALLVAGCGVTREHRPAYTTQPPTKGALYDDGQTGRYLLGGRWLYRGDPADIGVAGGWWRDTAQTAGWSPVRVPNAYNARDLSATSMAGSVGWYRRDFTLPTGAFAAYVPDGERRWIVRFESVNYRATVWLNGRRLGGHTGAYLPFELDLTGLNAGVNRLVVRVDDRHGPGDLPPDPGGGWWNFGGILREVYLRAVQADDISQVQVRPLLACPVCAAVITERALLAEPDGHVADRSAARPLWRQAARFRHRDDPARRNVGGLGVRADHAPAAVVTRSPGAVSRDAHARRRARPPAGRLCDRQWDS